jgi:transcriptional regulator with XRE-family HTH domain
MSAKLSEYELNVSAVNRWLKKEGQGSREKLARKVGLSAEQMDRQRRNKSLPTTKYMMRLSKVLGKPVEKLVIRKR